MPAKDVSATDIPNLRHQLDIDAERGTASMTLIDDESGDLLTTEIIHQKLEQAGIADWRYDDNGISELLKKYSRSIPVSIVIAERVDADIQLHLSGDSMVAQLTYTPPKGGRDASPNDVIALLKQKGVVEERINHLAIEKTLANQTNGAQPVALGIYPKNGQNSHFVALINVEDEEDQSPKEKEDGTIDFLAGRTYISVSEGTPLMRRFPPTPGKQGMTILGEALRAEPGKELPFGKKTDGCRIADDDPNLLVAAVDGHPVFQDDCVHVDNSLVLEKVGLSTGHIEFDGSVMVKGDVMADMKIICTGDVFIGGVVERAYIKAGANILIKGGAIGAQHVDESQKTYEKTSMPEDDIDHEQFSEEDQNLAHIRAMESLTLPEFECNMIAGGNIELRYVNLASLKADKEIIIREYAFNSELVAGETIKLGQNGGKGSLVGGIARAGHSIIAKSLGNKAYLHSYFQVGITTNELQHLRHLRFLRTQRVEQARALRRLLQELKNFGQKRKLEQHEVQKATKLHDTLLQIQEDLKELDVELAKLSAINNESNEPVIKATQHCYPNCFLTINGAFTRTLEEYRAKVFVKRGYKVTTI